MKSGGPVSDPETTRPAPDTTRPNGPCAALTVRRIASRRRPRGPGRLCQGEGRRPPTGRKPQPDEGPNDERQGDERQGDEREGQPRPRAAQAKTSPGPRPAQARRPAQAEPSQGAAPETKESQTDEQRGRERNAPPGGRPRHRLLALPRGPVPVAVPGGDGRRRHQGGAPHDRRRLPAEPVSAPRPLRLLHAAEPRQARPVPEHQGPPRRRAVRQAPRHRRRVRRELPPRRPDQARARLHRRRRPQPRHRLLLDQRLRAQRARLPPRRIRPHRRGQGRRHGDARGARRPASGLRHLDRRHVHRHPRRRRRQRRPLRAHPHRPRPAHRPRALRLHGLRARICRAAVPAQ